jgi:serine/threonine protein kinase
MVDRVGQQLGNYRLIRLLGKGGFAEVYLGEHIRLNSYAAVKVLNTQLTDREAESFQHEGLTIARLLHPHIIRVFDYDIAEGTPFLIMDYAPKGTLRSRHAKGVRVPLADIVSYVKQVTSALQYAHNERVIHRDIKPENMLIGRNNEVLLSDFGIATMTQSSRYQNTVDIVGTVAYMAPEQIQGKPHTASDQYSLGIVVYEWLSGERPFHGSFTEIAVQHAVTPPPPLHEKVPDISPEIEQVLQVALAKDPRQRFASVFAFANAFEQACKPGSPPVIETLPRFEPTLPAAPGESVTVLASPASQGSSSPTVPSPSTSSQRRRIVSRRTVLAGVAGLVVVVASGSIGWLARTPFHSLGAGPASTGTATRSTPTTPTPSPDATSIPVQNSPTSTLEPVVTGSWSQLPALLSPQADNAAIYMRFQQRDYIYMNGGYRGNNNSPTHDDALYRYDIGAAQWGAVTTNFPGMFNDAVALDEQNRLFFTAGYSPDTQTISSLLYMYRPDTGTVQTITPPPQISIGYGGSLLPTSVVISTSLKVFCKCSVLMQQQAQTGIDIPPLPISGKLWHNCL